MYMVSCVQLFVTPWTIAHRTGSSVHGIFQRRILKCVPFPPPGVLPDPGIKPALLASPARNWPVILYHYKLKYSLWRMTKYSDR